MWRFRECSVPNSDVLETALIQFITREHPQKPLCLVLGNFDGIHLGHQSLLLKAREVAQASRCEPALMRLDPHPSLFFSGSKLNELIQNQEQTVQLLRFYGVKNLLSFPFTKVTSQFTPEQFVDFMLENLDVKHLVVGRNYRFGRERSGNPTLLRQLSKTRQIEVHECEDVTDMEGVISSTRVRECIRQGDMQTAARLLGRHYFMEGNVVSGIQKGREMGTPTANIEPHDLLLPRSGVYATWLNLEGHWYPSITNVGERPTRGTPLFGIETHVIDAELDLYGRHVLLVFTSYLRNERAFNGFEELKQQIQSDIQKRRQSPDFRNRPDFSLFDSIVNDTVPDI